MTMLQIMNVLISSNICPKRAFFSKNSSWLILLPSLGLFLSSLLVKSVEMWLANLLTTIFTKNEPFNLYM